MTTSSTSRPSSASAETLLAGTPVHALWTGAGDGDLRSIGAGPLPKGVPDDLVVRRVRQVHGARVVVVDTPIAGGTAVSGQTVSWEPGPLGAPPEGDAVVARANGVVVAVLTADCAAVALGSPEGVHGAVHVGWRGLAAGVLPRAIDTMRLLGATTVVGGLGPCIGPCCCEFSDADLDALVESCGSDVEGRTSRGQRSLDLPAAVRGQLSRSGASLVSSAATCTMCTPGYFSHRARADEARQALLVWRNP